MEEKYLTRSEEIGDGTHSLRFVRNAGSRRTGTGQIVLGSGKKVFGSGTVPSNLTLAEPALTSPTGAVLLHYELASGIPRTGDMTREMTRT